MRTLLVLLLCGLAVSAEASDTNLARPFGDETQRTANVCIVTIGASEGPFLTARDFRVSEGFCELSYQSVVQSASVSSDSGLAVVEVFQRRETRRVPGTRRTRRPVTVVGLANGEPYGARRVTVFVWFTPPQVMVW